MRKGIIPEKIERDAIPPLNNPQLRALGGNAKEQKVKRVHGNGTIPGSQPRENP